MAKWADVEMVEFAAAAADGKCKVFLATKSWCKADSEQQSFSYFEVEILNEFEKWSVVNLAFWGKFNATATMDT